MFIGINVSVIACGGAGIIVGVIGGDAGIIVGMITGRRRRRGVLATTCTDHGVGGATNWRV